MTYHTDIFQDTPAHTGAWPDETHDIVTALHESTNGCSADRTGCAQHEHAPWVGRTGVGVWCRCMFHEMGTS